MSSATDLSYRSIVDAAGLIKKRELSPVELTQACLDRIAEVEPKVLAFVTLLAETAIVAAREAEAAILRGEYRGPLHGIPIVLKDLYNTKGIRTTASSKVRADYVPTYDAAATERLAAAGAILLGKVSNSLGALAYMQGNLEQAVKFYEESLTLGRQMQDEQLVAIVLVNLGDARRHLGDLESAVSLYDEALLAFQQLADKQGMAFTLFSLGKVAHSRQEHAQAVTHLIDSLTIFHEVGDRAAVAECLEGLASVALDRSDTTWAIRMLGASDATREIIAAPRSAASRAEIERSIETARSAVGDEAFTDAWRVGRSRSLQDAIDEALQFAV